MIHLKNMWKKKEFYESLVYKMTKEVSPGDLEIFLERINHGGERKNNYKMISEKYNISVYEVRKIVDRVQKVLSNKSI